MSKLMLLAALMVSALKGSPTKGSAVLGSIGLLPTFSVTKESIFSILLSIPVALIDREPPEAYAGVSFEVVAAI